jgi:hypothetical protein
MERVWLVNYIEKDISHQLSNNENGILLISDATG